MTPERGRNLAFTLLVFSVALSVVLLPIDAITGRWLGAVVAVFCIAFGGLALHWLGRA